MVDDDGSEAKKSYRFMAVINHLGTLGIGHYTTLDGIKAKNRAPGFMYLYTGFTVF